jgi:RHS repeat-associated protein
MLFKPSTARSATLSSLKKSIVARALVAVTVLLVAGSASGDGNGEPDPRLAPQLPFPIALPITPLIAATEGSGDYLPGSWDVTSAGAFTYSIPLEVPAGRNGMAPSLSLSYSSGTRNGILGAGWSLSGLSRITRCNKTIATESVVDGVDYEDFVTADNDTVDRFCLDGQKLVTGAALNRADAMYGKDGTEYRTEADIFARIVSRVSAANASRGPDSFTVWMKSGVVRTYVARYATRTQSSVSIVNGTVTPSTVDLGQFPVEWLLTTESDKSFNEVHYAYTMTSTGYLPQQISYTHNPYASGAAKNAQRFVTFSYEGRPDPVLAWQSGVRTMLDQRLKAIVMSAPNPASVEKVWEYELEYDPSVGSGRSLLRSVKRCGALGGCTREKQFGWSQTASPTFTATTIAPVSIGGADSGAIPADWWARVSPNTKVFDADGDGLDDVIYFPGRDYDPATGAATGTESDPQVRLGYRSPGAIHPLGHGFPALVSLGYLQPNSPVSYVLSNDRSLDTRPVDIDADGSAELWTYLDSTQYGLQGTVRHPIHWQSQPPTFVAVDIGFPEIGWFYGSVSPDVYVPLKTDFLDLNGDGLMDMISGHGIAQPDGPDLRVRMNYGGNSFSSGGMTGLDASCDVRVTDVDSDGAGDAVINCGANGGYLLTKGDGGDGMTVSELTNYPIAPGPGVHFGDFNGDGLEDVLLYKATDTTPAKILWNTGNGYEPSGATLALPHDTGFNYQNQQNPLVDEGVRIVDVDGDGRSDIVSFHKLPTPNITLLLSKGTGVFTQVDLDQDPGFQDIVGGWGSSQFGDFNGDGHPDIVKISDGSMVVLAQDPSYSDRLLSVTDELTKWARETITYSNEWSDRPDDKGSYTCAYPLHCIRHGFPVVRSVQSRAHLVDPSFLDVQVGARWTYYSYEDPVSDLRGRGFLGFGTFHVWDPQRPMETITKFDQRTKDGTIYPGAFRPKSVTTIVPILTQDEVAAAPLLANARVTESEYWYELRSLNSGISHAVFPYSSTTKEWEQPVTIDWATYGFSTSGRHLIGVYDDFAFPLREVARATELDDYGNTLLSWSWTLGGVTEGVSNTYEYRPLDWLISLPHEHCVRKTEEAAPGTPSVRRCETYTHDFSGRVATASIEEGDLNPDIPETTTFAYDTLGLSTSITFEAAGIASRTAHTEYEPVFPGQPDERVFPSQVWADHDVVAFRPSTWVISHPAYGVPVAMMDVNGVQTQIQYDDLGRPVSMQHDGDAPVTLSYSGRPDLNPNGGLNGTITQIQRGFQTSMVVADALGRTLRGSRTGFDGSMAETILSYDILGRTIQSDEPVDAQVTRTTKNKYDSLNRLLGTELPDGHKLVTTYPSMFVTQSFDAINNETDVTRDLDGRVITSVNILDTVPATPVTTHYSYAPFDQVDHVTDDVGHVTQMHYDVRGRQIQIDDPDQGTTTFDYNGFGNLYRSTHTASGQVKTYAYDDLGRLLGTLDPDGLTTFAWDASPFGIGKLASTLSPDDIATESRYDNRGRLAGEDLIDELNVKYSIDMSYVSAGGPLAGEPWTLSYPAVAGRTRFTVTSSYNNSGYVNEIFGNVVPGQPLKSLWAVKSRNRDMALLTGTLGNLTDIERGYDDLTSRMLSLKATGAAPVVTPVVDMGYEYHPNSLLKSRKDTVTDRNETFEYDSLLRLTEWSLKSDKAELFTQYSYDTIGNLMKVDENHHMVELNVYGVNGAQPHTLTDHLDGASGAHDLYAYDTLGRQTSGGGRTISSYSASDLPRTLIKNGITWTLAYDAFGRRVKKTGSDGTTTVYVGGLYEHRETSAGVQDVFHVDGTDGPVADVIFDGSKTRPNYIVSDPLGSTAVVLDTTGAVTDRFFYQPFGKRINADGTSFSGAIGPMKNGFTGQESDDAFGLINFQGRMYDPALKRFLSADPHVTFPAFGQSWNPYSYVLNSPLNFTDPSGFDTFLCPPGMYGCASGGGDISGGGSGQIGDETRAGSDSGAFGGGATGVTGDTSRGGGGGVDSYGFPLSVSDSHRSSQCDGSAAAAAAAAAEGGMAILPRALPALGKIGSAIVEGAATMEVLTALSVAIVVTGIIAIEAPNHGVADVDVGNSNPALAAAAAAALEMSKHKSDKKTKTGTSAPPFPRPNEKSQWYAVRVQAQGGGLERSVPIRQAVPVTVAQGLLALAALKAQLTPTQLRERSVAFAKAAAWIMSRPPYGAGPPGKSGFVDRADARGDIRVDVEILDGVNFAQ